MKRVMLVGALSLAFVAGCAQAPDQIEAAYVSPQMYSDMSCSAMQAEAARISSEVVRLTGVQQKKATNDAVAMGVGLVLFWPALFAVGIGTDVAPQLSQLKGQATALNAVYVAQCT